MHVLVLGSGAREHAICEALSRSKNLSRLSCAPGNPGIAEVAECVPIAVYDIATIGEFAKKNAVELVIPGPEISISAGIASAMQELGIPCCSPTKEAALLETSKLFTKNVCRITGVPTAPAAYFTESAPAREHLRHRITWPCVIKADGLAAGKGVVIAADYTEAERVVGSWMDDCALGDAGASILIEDFLSGEEVSFFALCHGTKIVPFNAAQDHKRIGEGDTGRNTGGMGAYAPPARFTKELQQEVENQIIHPVLNWMCEQGIPFHGVLFAGLMLTESGPQLVEFNVRFGDPECQTLLMLLESDLLDALHCTAIGRLDDLDLRWNQQHAISVVMAAPGYPDAPQTGTPISIGEVPDGVKIFHAGTGRQYGGQLVSSGGRVLSVCATGDTLAEAKERAHRAIQNVEFPGAYYRRDIGWRAFC